MAAKDERSEENPFTKGSVYKVVSLGTRDVLTESQGEFVGFTHVGMGGEGMVLVLADSHGDDAGMKRIIPLHMVMHVDVVSQAEAEEKKDEGHGPVYYS